MDGIKNIAQKSMKYIIILIATTISIFIAVNYVNNIKEETNVIIGKSLSDQMKKSNSFISKYLDNEIQLLRNVGESYEEGDIKTIDELQKYTSVLLDSNQFERVSIIDKKGYLFLEENKTIDIRHKNYYIDGLKGKVVISDIVDEISSEFQCISICVPIYKDNEIVSFIFAIKNAENLQKVLVENFNEDKGFTCIIDRSGNVVIRNKNSFNDADFSNFYYYMMDKAVGLDDYVERVRNGLIENKNDVIKVTNNNGNGYLGYAAVSEYSDWRIVSFIGEEKFLSYINSVTTESFKMLTYIILLILFVTICIFRIEINKKREIQRISSIDNLTEIGNQLKFFTETKKILKKHTSSEFIMVIFDIKKFKYINNNYGYDYGDYILKVIAKAIDKRFNNGETCGRINGDTFMILAKNSKDFILDLKIFLITTIYQCNSKGKDIFLKYNFGLYVIKDKKEDINQIVDKANVSWKHVKSHPKLDTYYYDEHLMKYLMEEEAIENKMKDALAKGEFKVYLQAIVNLENNKICGAEALIRWKSPEMGFLAPDSFIPLFEKNGFIVDIDFYVLEIICNSVNKLIEEGTEDFIFSVNQSRETISDPFYIEHLKTLVEKYDIPTHLIHLEVTENIFVDNYENILKVLAEVRKLGFKISMDDFGSGYSSLNLLKEMPINVLKIDRIFLNETANSNRGKLIIKSVIELAKNLEINVVCEGVETKEHTDFLKRVHCEMAQGFYYGRPIPMEEFNKLINK